MRIVLCAVLVAWAIALTGCDSPVGMVRLDVPICSSPDGRWTVRHRITDPGAFGNYDVLVTVEPGHNRREAGAQTQVVLRMKGWIEVWARWEDGEVLRVWHSPGQVLEQHTELRPGLRVEVMEFVPCSPLGTASESGN